MRKIPSFCSDISKLLYTISLITNIVLSMREHDRDQWENITDGIVYFMLSFVDLAYVNEVR